MIQAYTYLFLAIVAESVGSVGLKYSNGMTRPGPAAVVIVSYGLSFWLFALALRVLPLGISSALWAGMGIVFSIIAGIFLFNERLGWIEILGTTLILTGIALLTLYSKAGQHAA